ncbi:helix-turn-helix transcriptional regulator [Romboutsia sp. CE17]|uniref:helix-turn-helix domain-containing protein n=1 Tax=Romboutsia sp. CE17 TaxID=2724150 RepID=UPI001442B33B|nr:helix-turn-helix transcriptional regulator [Romboutsia sp. CE17]QJA08600.1 helix-turn-helix transcriptional regulator [Romboutsia sp. CE17]
METIGYRISKARRHMNINQKELALRANITEGSLSRYENDIREPKAAAITQLAEALNVSTDYLLGLTDDMEVQNNRLADKSDEEFEEIYELIKQRFESGNIMFDGEPASKEAIDSMLKAMRMGMLLALEEQKKNRNKNNK